MSNSALVVYTKLSPNHSGPRTQPISKFTPHHMSGNLSIETCGNVFAPPSRKASSNYGIGSDGRHAMYVPEAFRAWTSSSAWNDQRAVTVEVANSVCGGDWPISDAAWDALVDLGVDVCRRNPGIVREDGKTPGLWYSGDKRGSLTTHRMFANTDCPGTWLDNHMQELAAAVNKRLDGGGGTPKPVATAPAKPKKPAPAKGRVAEFQSWMNETYGWAMDIDNLFGPDTKKHAVMALQIELNRQFGKGLAIDGMFGSKTKAACISVKHGARGNITRILQGMLYCKGYDPTGFDGVFGDGTKKALGKYQTTRGLTVDYIAGKNTFASLFA